MRPALQIEVDATRIVRLADAFGANIKQMKAAQFRALNKTLRWVRGRSVKAISHELNIPQKLAKQRVAHFLAKRSSQHGRVYAGLNPISARRLGKVKQLKRGGVRVGRHKFDDAFAVDTGKGRLKVFRRTGEAKRKPTKGRYAGTGIKREPIEGVDLDVDINYVRDALDDVYSQAGERYFTILKQELKYEVFVKNAR